MQRQKLEDFFLQHEFLQKLARAVSASCVQEKVHRSLHELSVSGLYGPAQKTRALGADAIQILSASYLPSPATCKGESCFSAGQNYEYKSREIPLGYLTFVIKVIAETLGTYRRYLIPWETG